MEFKELSKRAEEIKTAYKAFNRKNGQKEWGALEYTEGLVGDLGDLMKLMMAKNNLRNADNIDNALAHELSDCLWSIIVISQELELDLEKEFLSTMNELEKKIQ